MTNKDANPLHLVTFFEFSDDEQTIHFFHLDDDTIAAMPNMDLKKCTDRRIRIFLRSAEPEDESIV